MTVRMSRRPPSVHRSDGSVHQLLSAVEAMPSPAAKRQRGNVSEADVSDPQLMRMCAVRTEGPGLHRRTYTSWTEYAIDSKSLEQLGSVLAGVEEQEMHNNSVSPAWSLRSGETIVCGEDSEIVVYELERAERIHGSRHRHTHTAPIYVEPWDARRLGMWRPVPPRSFTHSEEDDLCGASLSML